MQTSERHVHAQSRWGHRSILSALLLAQIVGVMEISMTYAAVPSFYHLFGRSNHMVWLFTGFLLVAGVSASFLGSLGDAIGRRRVLIVVLILAGLGSVLGLFAAGLDAIIAGRMFQGVSIAITPLCAGLIREHMPEATVPRSVGLLVIAAHSISGVFFLLGGAVVDHLGWRWVFGLTALMTVVALFAVQVVLPVASRIGSSRTVGSLDWLGAFLFGASIAALLLTLSLSTSHGYLAPEVLLSGTIGLGLLALWIPHTLRHAGPLIDIRLLRSRQVAITLAIFTFLCMGTQQYPMIVLVLLQQPLATGAGFGLSATYAGATQIPAALAGVAAGMISGILAGRLGGRPVLLAGAVILGAGWTMFFFGQANLPLFFIGMLLVYAGVATVFTGTGVLLIQGVPQSRTSEVMGLSEVVRTIGNAFGAQFVTLVFVGRMVKDTGGGAFPDAHAYSIAIGAIALTCVVAVIAMILTPFQKELSMDGRPPDIGKSFSDA
jgi:MFS family permease